MQWQRGSLPPGLHRSSEGPASGLRVNERMMHAGLPIDKEKVTEMCSSLKNSGAKLT